jgi:uncharacterized protein YcbK (DUF882 family)
MIQAMKKNWRILLIGAALVVVVFYLTRKRMQLTANFSKKEFESKDGSPMPLNVLENVKQLAKQLQVLRDHTGKSVTILSGYRSPAHNTKIGGATNSQHLYGRAADIRVSGMTPAQVQQTIEQLIAAGKMKNGGLGRYSTFTHYDIRNNPARWNG